MRGSLGKERLQTQQDLNTEALRRGASNHSQNFVNENVNAALQGTASASTANLTVNHEPMIRELQVNLSNLQTKHTETVSVLTRVIDKVNILQETIDKQAVAEVVIQLVEIVAINDESDAARALTDSIFAKIEILNKTTNVHHSVLQTLSQRVLNRQFVMKFDDNSTSTSSEL